MSRQRQLRHVACVLLVAVLLMALVIAMSAFKDFGSGYQWVSSFTHRPVPGDSADRESETASVDISEPPVGVRPSARPDESPLAAKDDKYQVGNDDGHRDPFVFRLDPLSIQNQQFDDIVDSYQSIYYPQAPNSFRKTLARDGVLYALGIGSPPVTAYTSRYASDNNARLISYQTELSRSLTSLRQHSPKLAVALVTDSLDHLWPNITSMLDFVVAVPRELPRSELGDKLLAMLLSPFKRTLYLDLDTEICLGVEQMFQFVRWENSQAGYDMAVACETPARESYRAAINNVSKQTSERVRVCACIRACVDASIIGEWHHL